MTRPRSLSRRIVRYRLLRPLRLARLRWIARHGGHQDWAKVIGPDRAAWDAARESAAAGRRVLIATGTGGHLSVTAIDRLLAAALTLRGGAATVALCDGILDACQRCEVNLFPDTARFARQGPARDLCGSCYGPTVEACAALGVPTTRYGDHHPEADRRRVSEVLAGIGSVEEAFALQWNGVAVGEHALAGALRFFARAELRGEHHGQAVLMRYLAAALRTALVAERMIATLSPEVVVLHHGIYVPQGVFAEVARRLGTRVVTWTPAYRKHCFLFAHGETYHRALMEEPADSWADVALSTAQQEQIGRYLQSRWTGTEDWIQYHQPPDMALTHDLAGLGLARGKPLILALTNVMWDAQLHYPANAFASQREWLVDTVRWFAARQDLQLAIRVHPAEISGYVPSRQKVAQELARAFPELPANVVVIPPESALSTYDLARQADTALIYATKAGVELAAMGIPVVVAGEAWVRNKGITADPTSREAYLACLDALPRRERLPPALVERARRYAYHFFFRRMIPLEMVEKTAGLRMFTVTSTGVGPLLPGASQGLDAICAGILDGAPFHMPDDALAQAAAQRYGARAA